MQKQRLSVQVVLQSERGSVPQAEVRVLNQLCAEQPSKVKHLVYLRPGLDGTGPFNAHIVDSLTGANSQSVDQVTGYQDTC